MASITIRKLDDGLKPQLGIPGHRPPDQPAGLQDGSRRPLSRSGYCHQNVGHFESCAIDIINPWTA